MFNDQRFEICDIGDLVDFGHGFQPRKAFLQSEAQQPLCFCGLAIFLTFDPAFNPAFNSAFNPAFNSPFHSAFNPPLRLPLGQALCYRSLPFKVNQT